MILRILILAVLFVASTVQAGGIGESFIISCDAEHLDTREYLGGKMDLTIHERPLTGISMTYDYRVFTAEALPYTASLEVAFGETLEEDVWILYFSEINSAEELGLTQESISSDLTETTINLESPEGPLRFTCLFEWKSRFQ